MNELTALSFFSFFYLIPVSLSKTGRKTAAAGTLFVFVSAILSFFPLIRMEPAILLSCLWALLSSLAALFLLSKKTGAGTARLTFLKTELKKKEAELAALKTELSKNSSDEKRLSLIYSVFKTLSESLNLTSAAAPMSRYIAEYLGGANYSFLLYDREKGKFSRFCGISLSYQEKSLFSAPDGSPFSDGELVFSVIKDGAAPFCALVVEEKDPLKHIERGETSLAFLREIQPALKRLGLFERIESLSEKDGLTGIFRRGAFDSRIMEEMKRARAFKTSLCLMIADIDHFKKINDSYGHQTGDMILKGVAAALKRGVYETDVVARYGGEEFAIILPRADFEGAFRKAEYLRESIEREKFDLGFEKIGITISIGVAHYPRDSKNEKELIAKADTALYKAKETGRNKVVDAEEI